MNVFCYYGGICTSVSGLCFAECPKRKHAIANDTTRTSNNYANRGYNIRDMNYDELKAKQINKKIK